MLGLVSTHMIIDRQSWQVWGREQALNVTIVCGATALSLAIVQQNWLYVLALFGIPLAVAWPVPVCLGLFAFLVPFDSIARISGQGLITLNWAVGAVAGAVLVIVGALTGRLQRPPIAALWWSLFIAWGALTSLWALDPEMTWERLPMAVSLLLLYLAAVSFRVTSTEVIVIMLFCIAGGVSAAVYTAAEMARSFNGSLRWSLEGTNPNIFAASLLLPLSLAIGQFLSVKNRMGKSWMLLAIGILGTVALLTMSRGSLVAIAVMLAVFAYRLGVNRWSLLIIAMIAVLVLLMPSTFFVRVAEGLESRAQGRFDIWNVGTELVARYGIFGVGLSNFAVGYAQFAGYAEVFRGYERAPHNIYLGVIAELGIVGLSLFVGTLASQLRGIHRAIKKPSMQISLPLVVAVEAGCWALLAHGLVLDLLWRKAFWFAWILLALTISAESMGRTKPLNSHDQMEAF
jgi:O-antigen ligase